MNAAPARATSQITRSRGTGAAVGTIFGAGWLAFGISRLPAAWRVAPGLLGLGIALLLLNRSRRVVDFSRTLAAPTSEQHAANRRAWRWFWINFVVEIALLNLAVNLLIAPASRVYWLPAIGLVVGVHFLPMAWFFEVPSYWFCGGAMIGMAALTILALREQAPVSPAVAAAVEAVVNACILWTTVWWGTRGLPGSGHG